MAQALKWSLSKFIRVEGGLVRISQADLEYLLRYYKVTGQHIKNLSDLADGARRPGWWRKYPLPDDKAFIDYVGYETDASRIQLTQGSNIPGLHQTDTYMRLIAGSVWRFR